MNVAVPRTTAVRTVSRRASRIIFCTETCFFPRRHPRRAAHQANTNQLCKGGATGWNFHFGGLLVDQSAAGDVMWNSASLLATRELRGLHVNVPFIEVPHFLTRLLHPPESSNGQTVPRASECGPKLLRFLEQNSPHSQLRTVGGNAGPHAYEDRGTLLLAKRKMIRPRSAPPAEIMICPTPSPQDSPRLRWINPQSSRQNLWEPFTQCARITVIFAAHEEAAMCKRYFLSLHWQGEATNIRPASRQKNTPGVPFRAELLHKFSAGAVRV